MVSLLLSEELWVHVIITTLYFSRKIMENSKNDKRFPLFFRSPGLRKPRISAVNETRLAVNFRAKQRKQREIAILGPRQGGVSSCGRRNSDGRCREVVRKAS